MCTIYITDIEESKKNIAQTEHLAGLRLLSYALKDSAGILMTEKELTEDIQKESKGKPFLKSHKNICYNISHCRDMVACGISHSPIGIDLERIHSFLDSILRRVLTPSEKEFFQKVSVDEQAREEWFFRIWTLKESYIKFTGDGLAMPLTDFSFSFDLDKSPFEISCSAEGVYFTQHALRDQHILSLCTSTPQTDVKIIYV